MIRYLTIYFLTILFSFCCSAMDEITNAHPLKEEFDHALQVMGTSSNDLRKYKLFFGHSDHRAYSLHNTTYISPSIEKESDSITKDILSHEAYHVYHNHYRKKQLLFWTSSFTSALSSLRLITGFKIKSKSPGIPTVIAAGASLAGFLFGQPALTHYQEYQARIFARNYVLTSK